jgi:superfamily II DNA or RNA helicase
MDEISQLKLYVDNTTTSISGKFRGPLYKEFKQLLGYQPEDMIWRMQNNKHWDGYVSCVCYSRDYCKCPIKKDGMHFPTGLYSKAIAFFNEKGIPIEVVDVRDAAIAASFRECDLHLAEQIQRGKELVPLKLHDYQVEAVSRAVAQQRGILQLATGAGKTVTAAAIIAALGVKPAIFYVTSTDLLKQAADEIELFVRQSGLAIEIGRVGGGHKKVRDITVMTVQTAVRALGHKYVKCDEEDSDDSTNIDDVKKDVVNLIQSAKLVFFDECHHVAAETCQVVAGNSLSARWRYGLSATPYRDKGDDILIDACFGKTIMKINASYLVDRGFLVKPSIAFVHIKNMKGEKLGSWPVTYKTAVVENGYRNQIISQLANNLTEMGRTVLVLVQQIQHGEMLSEMIPNSVFLHGSCTKKQREDHIDLMKKGKASITIASTIMDEGMDCKPLNALILAGGGKSPTRALQRIGRVIRTNTYPDGTVKKDAFVYDLYDHQKYLTTHAMARRKIYMSEPSFDIRDAEI